MPVHFNQAERSAVMSAKRLLWNILILTPPSKCPAEIALKCFLWRWWGFAEDKHSLANRFEMTDLLRFPCLLVCHCYNLYLLSYLIWPHSAHFVRVCLEDPSFVTLAPPHGLQCLKLLIRIFFLSYLFFLFSFVLFLLFVWLVGGFGGGNAFHTHEVFETTSFLKHVQDEIPHSWAIKIWILS